MTNPTQDSLDHVARLNGYRDWEHADATGNAWEKKAMKHHALDRDKWLAEKAELEAQFDDAKSVIAEANNSLFGSQGYFLSLTADPPSKYHLSGAIEDLKSAARKGERQPVNWQDNMDFEPSEGSVNKTLGLIGPWRTTAARLIDHLEGTAPEKVDRDREALVQVILAWNNDPSEDRSQIIEDPDFPAALAKFKELTNG